VAVSIGGNAFDRITSLTSVSFPKATTIGGAAFIYCTGLTSVSFPEALSIGSSAFSGCTGLSSASFPKVTSIATQAFQDTGTVSLTITLPQNAPQVSSTSTGSNSYAKSVTVKTPANRIGYDTYWQSYFKGTFSSKASINLTFQ
jgi:hypothetical protein